MILGIVVEIIYKYSIILILSFAVVTFLLLFSISAPYGKFSRKGWGPAIKSKWAWMIMEFPSPALILVFFITSAQKSIPQVVFIIVWLSHYLLRTFIYPFRQSGKLKPFPIIVVLMAITFNCMNGLANGYGVFHLYSYSNTWLCSWQFIGGIVLFIAGFVINKSADERLRSFRDKNPSEYVIPQGGLFNFISCPHYLGEIIEWGGWGLMTWSFAGFAFFIFTFANLFPRAIASHKWYKATFHDYPQKRKAVIPFLI